MWDGYGKWKEKECYILLLTREKKIVQILFKSNQKLQFPELLPFTFGIIGKPQMSSVETQRS